MFSNSAEYTNIDSGKVASRDLRERVRDRRGGPNECDGGLGIIINEGQPDTSRSRR